MLDNGIHELIGLWIMFNVDHIALTRESNTCKNATLASVTTEEKVAQLLDPQST